MIGEDERQVIILLGWLVARPFNTAQPLEEQDHCVRSLEQIEILH